MLLADLARDWEIELLSGRSDSSPARAGGRGSVRSIASGFAMSVLLDKCEPWARLRCVSLPSADAAYLVGAPYSPLVYAARSLAKRGVPYVVDVGDPWVLTASELDVHRLALRRARRLERPIWENAAGAVVTTRRQEEALRRVFSDLPILVRPNGTTVDGRVTIRERPVRDGRLRLGHFGTLYGARLDVARLLESLGESGLWDAVELHQYGPDWTRSLNGLRSVHVIQHAPVPWVEAQRAAAALDAALVIGNRDRSLLPSKAIDYLTLPVPRIAIAAGDSSDALAEYVQDKPGWLVLAIDAADASTRVYEHVSRSWAVKSLLAPSSESWDVVTPLICSFVRERILASAVPEYTCC